MQDPAAETTERVGLFRFYPKLDREERIELLERVQLGATANVDYVIMMILSATLASLGLLQGSTAVVIGAMLVAPLMGPLIGAGFALVQGNAKLFRRAVGVTLLGVLIGFLASLLFGLANPGYEASVEVESRGTPDLLDLVIALASGMVAAYAMARPNLSSTIAGVAIAAALLPPLAVVGICLTNDEYRIASNAAILLVTNLIAIILGAAFIFRTLGLHLSRRGEGLAPWALRALMLLALGVAFLIPPLLGQIVKEQRTGQNRPHTYPVAPVLSNAVEAFMAQYPATELISIARFSIEPEAGVTVVAATNEALPPDFERRIKGIIEDVRQTPTNVRVFTLLEAPMLSD